MCYILIIQIPTTWVTGKYSHLIGRWVPLCLCACFSTRRYGDQTYFEEIKQFYYRDEFSHQVQEWNRQRTLAIEHALKHFLYPQMAKELKNKLLAEAKDSIVKVPLSPFRLLALLLVQPVFRNQPGGRHKSHV